MAGTLCGLALASAAFAGAGDHIRAGDAVITPSLGVGVEYRSNVYLRTGENFTGDPADKVVGGANFYLVPAFKVAAENTDYRFDFVGHYYLRKYFKKSLAENLDRFTDFDVATSLMLMRRRVFGINLSERATIRNQPSDQAWLPTSFLSQFRNDVGAGFAIRPGPELQIKTDGGWSYHNYLVPGGDGLQAYNSRNAYAAKLGVEWRFFPRTAFVVDATYIFNDWRDNFVETNGDGTAGGTGAFLAMPNSHEVKGWVGIRGRFTERLVLQLMAGYGTSIYLQSSVEDGSPEAGDGIGFDQNVSGLDGLLIQAKATYDLGHSEGRRFGNRFNLQYRKDFLDSYFTNFEAYNKIYANIDSLWGRYVSTRAGFQVVFENFKGEVTRNDVVLRADLDLDVQPLKWLTLNAGGYWIQRASSDPNVQYDDFQFHFVTTFTY